jgi:glycosyltransferase involved in cell wall biosynthesis
MANKCGIARQVKIVRFKKNPAYYLSVGDAYVCSSLFEGWPLARLAEETLAGLPVIVIRVGAFPEMIVHGVSDNCGVRRLLAMPISSRGDGAARAAADDGMLIRVS